MRKMMTAIWCGMCLILSGQTRPTTQSAPNGFADYSITDPRVQDLAGFEYLYSSRKITIRQMNQVMSDEVAKLLAAAKTHGISPAGPLVLISQGMSGNPDQPFDLEMGFAVDKGTVAPPRYAVKHVPAQRFATVILSGPSTQIRFAYHKLYQAIFGAGLQPGEEGRQYFLYWEGNDSVNNVMMIAVRVQ